MTLNLIYFTSVKYMHGPVLIASYGCPLSPMSLLKTSLGSSSNVSLDFVSSFLLCLAVVVNFIQPSLPKKKLLKVWSIYL